MNNILNPFDKSYFGKLLKKAQNTLFVYLNSTLNQFYNDVTNFLNIEFNHFILKFIINMRIRAYNYLQLMNDFAFCHLKIS